MSYEPVTIKEKEEKKKKSDSSKFSKKEKVPVSIANNYLTLHNPESIIN